MEINTGAMGENLVIEGIDETDVCIGDTYEIGDALVEVSQPRQPCWKPARRFGVIDFALRIQKSGSTGWYYRVLKEGYIEGDSMKQSYALAILIKYVMHMSMYHSRVNLVRNQHDDLV